jgi:SAM-dependent methyltransferase
MNPWERGDRRMPTSNYDQIGVNYASTRQADPRFAAQIREALGDAKSVVNVGAGSGSYEPVDRFMVAVEPSQVMIRQRPPLSAPAVRGVAERLPFADDTFDVAMAVFTLHHWQDLDGGLSELRRVARKRIVVLMSDPGVEESFWLNRDYFPTMTQHDRRLLTSADDVLRRLGGMGTIKTVLVPHDCLDGFCSAYWRRPDAYLDPVVRSGISYFSILDKDVIEQGLEQLSRDLAGGAWESRFGHLRQLEELDTGQRLIVADV